MTKAWLNKPTGDKYYDTVNWLSGQSNEMLLELLEWIFEDENGKNREKKMKFLYKMILGCDDPRPVNDYLWNMKMWKEDPLSSLDFKRFCLRYIPPSIILNFQLEDSDLSRKALFVGNITQQKKKFGDIRWKR